MGNSPLWFQWGIPHHLLGKSPTGILFFKFAQRISDTECNFRDSYRNPIGSVISVIARSCFPSCAVARYGARRRIFL